jgi:hypothetical protein
MSINSLSILYVESSLSKLIYVSHIIRVFFIGRVEEIFSEQGVSMLKIACRKYRLNEGRSELSMVSFRKPG